MKKSSDSTIGLLALNAVEIIFSVFVILNGNSVWNAEYKVDHGFDKICLVLAVMLALCSINVLKVKSRIGFHVFVLTLVLLLYLFFTWSTTVFRVYTNLYLVGLPCLILYFAQSIKSGRPFDLFYKIENIIVCISIVSTTLWVIGPLMGIVSPNTSITVEWGGVKTYDGYWSLLYESQLSDIPFFHNSVWRNSSIFTEGPMFNFWVSLSLFIEFFLRKTNNWKKIIILLTTLITTFTTTGVLCVIIFAVFKLYLSFYTSRQKISFVRLIFPLVFLYLMSLVVDVLNFKSSVNDLSYTTRLTDYLFAFNLWKNHPVFGTGYANVIDLFFSADRQELGYSNTALAVLATGGIWVTVIVFYPLIKSIKNYLFISHVVNIAFFSLFVIFLMFVVSFFAKFILVVLISFFYAVSDRYVVNRVK